MGLPGERGTRGHVTLRACLQGAHAMTQALLSGQGVPSFWRDMDKRTDETNIMHEIYRRVRDAHPHTTRMRILGVVTAWITEEYHEDERAKWERGEYNVVATQAEVKET